MRARCLPALARSRWPAQLFLSQLAERIRDLALPLIAGVKVDHGSASTATAHALHQLAQMPLICSDRWLAARRARAECDRSPPPRVIGRNYTRVTAKADGRAPGLLAGQPPRPSAVRRATHSRASPAEHHTAQTRLARSLGCDPAACGGEPGSPSWAQGHSLGTAIGDTGPMTVSGHDVMPGLNEISHEDGSLPRSAATYWPESAAAMSSRMRAGGRCCS